MDISDTVKFIFALIIGAGVVFGYQTIANWKDAHDREGGRVAAEQSTRAIIKDGDESSSARDDADKSGAGNRQVFEESVDQEGKNDRQTASRDNSNVPASRLRAFEKRRVERERIACERLRRSGLKCTTGSSSEEPAER